MKYIYPAVFTPLDNGEYSAAAPDLPGCVTCGKDLRDALEMAQDAISMWLCDAEDCNEKIPPPSNIQDLNCDSPSFISLVMVDTVEYRAANDNRTVKKTLSVPNWLNKKAEKAGINFSKALQDALKERLGIKT